MTAFMGYVHDAAPEGIEDDDVEGPAREDPVVLGGIRPGDCQCVRCWGFVNTRWAPIPCVERPVLGLDRCYTCSIEGCGPVDQSSRAPGSRPWEGRNDDALV